MSTHMQKISITAQFSIEIMQNQYWELLLACLVVSDYTHVNGLNQMDVVMYTGPHTKNQLNTSAHF